MKKIIILIFVLLFSLISEAQYSRRVVFQPEMYIGLSGGLNSYWGEGFTSYMQTIPQNSLGPMGRAVIGFRFSPFLGLRISPGFAIHNWPDNRRNDSIVNFSSDNLTFDLMVNLSNVFYYQQARNFNLYLFGGAGVAFRNPAPLLHGSLLTPVLRGGLQGDIALTDALDLNFSGELNLVTDAFNGYPATGFDGTPVDLYPALMVGLTYHFKSSKTPCYFKTIRIVGSR